MPRAVIIGATSGIGRALAVELSRCGYAVGVTGRRGALLRSLQEELPGPYAWVEMDVTQPDAAVAQLQALIAELGGMDLIVISSGVGISNPEQDWQPELATIAVNVAGFAAIASAAFQYFVRQGSGHLAGISSIAGFRGSRRNPAYGASKAFVMNYLEGLRWRARRLGVPLQVTDIRPGFIYTPMTAKNARMFWVATPEHAARQIADALEKKRRIAYITHRWSIIAWLVRHLPEWVLARV